MSFDFRVQNVSWEYSIFYFSVNIEDNGFLERLRHHILISVNEERLVEIVSEFESEKSFDWERKMHNIVFGIWWKLSVAYFKRFEEGSINICNTCCDLSLSEYVQLPVDFPSPPLDLLSYFQLIFLIQRNRVIIFNWRHEIVLVHSAGW